VGMRSKLLEEEIRFLCEIEDRGDEFLN